MYMSSFIKFFRLTPLEKGLFLEAMLTLLMVKLMIIVLPMRFYSRYLGNQHSESAQTDVEKNAQVIRNISKGLVRARKATPWPTRCLVDAITAKWMLNRRGVSSTLYLGVAKDDDKMIAHAWLRSGQAMVTGRQGIQKFTVVGTFA
jgi:hypothetical protein